jgi:6-phosphogluconate dehydrogenase
MQLGMIGLGRMGANMVRRLMRGGHRCVVHDTAAAAVQVLAGDARPPVDVSADVPPAVSAPVMPLLAKRADDRPASSERLRELLAERG